jgi:hypothetical protein
MIRLDSGHWNIWRIEWRGTNTIAARKVKMHTTQKDGRRCDYAKRGSLLHNRIHVRRSWPEATEILRRIALGLDHLWGASLALVRRQMLINLTPQHHFIPLQTVFCQLPSNFLLLLLSSALDVQMIARLSDSCFPEVLLLSFELADPCLLN